MWAKFVFCLLCIVFVLASAEDFYQLLGVPRDASTRVHVSDIVSHFQDIRRAFKKIALEKHPDKNPKDPHAHDNFVKINRAFEILKDDETRKKYDVHGEEGLKQEHQQQQYQGWTYYNEVKFARAHLTF
jgi:DnaJ family protein C protein 10